MTLAEKIVAHLRAAGVNWTGPARIRRTRAGRHQRAAGAWSWFLEGECGLSYNVGSQYPAVWCAMSGAVVSGDGHGGWVVDPSDETAKVQEAAAALRERRREARRLEAFRERMRKK